MQWLLNPPRHQPFLVHGVCDALVFDRFLDRAVRINRLHSADLDGRRGADAGDASAKAAT
jgi:hypothetical protein